MTSQGHPNNPGHTPTSHPQGGLTDSARKELEIKTASSIATLETEVKTIHKNLERIEGDSSKVPSVLTSIKFHSIGFAVIMAIAGWSGKALYDLNKEVGTNSSKIADFDKKLDQNQEINKEVLEKLNILISDSQHNDPARLVATQPKLDSTKNN